MLNVISFYGYSLLATIFLSALFFYSTLKLTNRKVYASISISVPWVLILGSMLLSKITISFYPARINFSTFILFFLIPLIVIFFMYISSKTVEKNNKYIKILQGYTLIATFLYFSTVIYHPRYGGPSASNGWDLGDMEYSCQDDYYLVVRNINLHLIDCSDDIFRWAEINNKEVCELYRLKNKRINMIDQNYNSYIFSDLCQYQKKEN